MFDIFYGWGEVINIITDDSELEEYPIRIIFTKKGVILSYMKNGKFEANDNFPRLSFTEYTLQGFTQERHVDYKNYVGSHGKFWNDDSKEVVIGKLVSHMPNVFEDYSFKSGDFWYKNFKPLTKKQIEILNLK